jgi:hypothetical protein
VWFAFVPGATADSIPASVTGLAGAETALVAAVEQRGMRDALDSRLSPLAMLFQPYPTMGPPWIKEHAAPDARWAPEFVEVSGVGDLGYTVGPWHTTGVDSTPLFAGSYLSFWRYHERTDWKMMLHITDGAPVMAPPALPVGNQLHFAMGPVPVVASHDTVAARRNALGGADEALTASVAKNGWREAFAAFTAVDVRCYRPGEPPAVGQAAVLESLAKDTGTVEWDLVGSWLAQSVDLGYTYGKCRRGTGAAKEPKTEWAYVHVWRMDRGGSRRLALEFLAPIVRK